MLKHTKILALAVAAVAAVPSAFASNFDHSKITAEYTGIKDVDSFTITLDHQFSDNFIFTAGAQPVQEKVTIGSNKIDTTLVNYNIGIKTVFPAGDMVDVYAGLTANYVDATTKLSWNHGSTKASGSDFGFGAIIGTQIAVSDSMALYGEFNHVNVDGDEIDLRHNAFQVGGRYNVTDSFSFNVALTQAKIWNSSISSSDAGYESGVTVGVGYHF